MRSLRLSGALAWWLAAGPSLAQYDPLNDFCRRWGHQSAVVDRKLYIDGGLVNYKPFTAESQNISNTFLAYNDLDSVSSGGMPPLYATLAKNATIPNVNGGILWPDSVNKRLYLYGGEVVGTRPSSFVLYSYDILYNQWVSFGPPGGAQTINAVSYGAGVSIPARGEAYYYGGWQSNASIPGWTGPPLATNRMVKYVMDTNSWSNITGPDEVRRAEGVMVFVPIGDAGMLVYFGGSQDLYGDGSITPQPLDKIFLYDVANAKWYTQRTTGRTPEIRRRFCAGAAWAQDQSSYNIYIYGGAGFPPATTGYDDIYILTLPSFQWIRGPYPPGSNVTGAYPKSMMSCNVVGDAQMLVIGGTYSNDSTYMCDADTVWGEHNMNLGEQNPQTAIWGLYQPSLTTYVVPTDILTAVGGGPTGGATVTAPTAGFDFPDLKVQMTRKAVLATRTPTRDVNVGRAPPLSTGAIAGIAVGGAVVLIAAVVGCCVFFRRRRRAAALRQQQQEQQQSPGHAHSHYGGSPGQGHGAGLSQHGFPALSQVSSPTLASTTGPHHHSPYGGPPVELAGGGYFPSSPGIKYDAHGYAAPVSELPTDHHSPAPPAESAYPSPTPTRAEHSTGYPATPPSRGYGSAGGYRQPSPAHQQPQRARGVGYGQSPGEYNTASNFGSPRQDAEEWDNGGWGSPRVQQQDQAQQQQRHVQEVRYEQAYEQTRQQPYGQQEYGRFGR